jgi:dipeptidyl aminopeptidase/acylaminoacyl peptidase
MLAMDRISDCQVSPDGKWIVFTLRKTDLEANRGRTDIWLVGADGKNLRPLTSHPASDSNARWSACGKCIFFLSTRSGSSQVWRIRLDGGEAQQVTDLPLDVSNLVASPDKKHIAFTVEVFPGKTIGETVAILKERQSRKASGRLYERIFVRHWDTWKDGRRSHLFVMPLEGGEARDLMAGMDADTPSKPFGGTEEIAFAPDGKGLVFTARDVGNKEPWSTNLDLFYVPIDGSKKPVCLTEKNEATDTTPVFSPDGKTLAYLAMTRPGYEADRLRIVLMPWPEGEPRMLTEKWDYSPSSFCWSPSGEAFYVAAPNLGQTSLFAVDTRTGQGRIIVKDGTISSPAPAGERIIFEMNNLKSPVEIYSVKPDGSDMQVVTAINAKKVATARMGYYEQFTFSGWKNETVYCYVVKPVDFDSSKKYPVAFLIQIGRAHV